MIRSSQFTVRSGLSWSIATVAAAFPKDRNESLPNRR